MKPITLSETGIGEIDLIHLKQLQIIQVVHFLQIQMIDMHVLIIPILDRHHLDLIMVLFLTLKIKAIHIRIAQRLQIRVMRNIRHHKLAIIIITITVIITIMCPIYPYRVQEVQDFKHILHRQ